MTGTGLAPVLAYSERLTVGNHNLHRPSSTNAEPGSADCLSPQHHLILDAIHKIQPRSLGLAG